MNTYEGKVNFSSKSSKEQLWAVLKNLKGDWWIRIDKSPRSISANNYYHVLLNILSEHTGHEHYELHEYFKNKFLPKFVRKRGKEFMPGSTSELNSDEFNVFLEKVKLFSIEFFELELPDPKQIYDYK